MNRNWTGLIAAFVLFGATALAADAPNGWLNVRDFGASGSRFETTAKTEAGSNEIVVKDAGDFKVGQGVQISRAHVHYEKQSNCPKERPLERAPCNKAK